MPFLTVKLLEPTVEETRRRIAEELTKLTVHILRKKRELTAVHVEGVDRSAWFIGANRLSSDESSFYVEVKITEGTNTKDEKAAFISQVFAHMGKILGPVSPASYVVLQDIRAEAWGYGGHTQEHRYIAGKLR